VIRLFPLMHIQALSAWLLTRAFPHRGLFVLMVGSSAMEWAGWMVALQYEYSRHATSS